MTTKQNKITNRPELLAPAGSVESFYSAIDAGADAVYLGLTDFNARLRAKNFTTETLSYAVPYAHSRNVRIYVTFNTLVKQPELERAVHFLYQLEQIGVDGLIVQDAGIIAIARSHFPRLRLHGSTQMAVHNSAGVETCGRMGLSRVIAARECTMEEIGRLCGAGGVQVEVFVHGALCYCLSGMCLASSFFGGSSGNRGRCTQVCRRKFTLAEGPADASGYYFSANDFCGLPHLQKLAQAGVAAFKIEGRMKSAAYVATVVAAYRKAIDDPLQSAAALQELERDLGRKKTTLFLDGVTQSGIIDTENPSGTGIYVGKIEKASEKEIFVRTAETLEPGGILRIQPQSGYEGTTAVVASCRAAEGVLCILLESGVACAAGDAVFFIGAKGQKARPEIKMNVTPARYRETFPDARRLLQESGNIEKDDKNRDRRLFVKIDSPAWLPLLRRPAVGGVICAFDKDEMLALCRDAPALEALGRAGYMEPPPFLPERELGEWRGIVQSLCKDGPCGLFCQNLGHVALARGVKRVRADYKLWCLNTAAQAAWASLNLSHFTYSPEDDSMNIGSCASGLGMLYLFGHVPLFVSRIRPGLAGPSRLVDAVGRTVFTFEKHGLYYLVAGELASLFHKREKLERLGIRTFCIDLSFMNPDVEVLDAILDCYASGKKYPGSCLFNFKGGLK
jgi:putative protease